MTPTTCPDCDPCKTIGIAIDPNRPRELSSGQDPCAACGHRFCRSKLDTVPERIVATRPRDDDRKNPWSA